MLLRPGDTFAGCRILSLCGSGGMGVVYLAQDAVGRTLALKVVPLCDSPRELTGRRRYFRTAAGSCRSAGISNAEYVSALTRSRRSFNAVSADPVPSGKNRIKKRPLI